MSEIEDLRSSEELRRHLDRFSGDRVIDDNEADLKLQDEGATQFDRDMEKAAFEKAQYKEDMRQADAMKFKRYSKSSECSHDWNPTGMFLMKPSEFFLSGEHRMVGGDDGPNKNRTPEVEACRRCGLLRIPIREGSAEIQSGKLG